MNKDFKRFFILSILLVIVSSIVIVLFGRTYTVRYHVNNEMKHDIIIENITGEVEILDKKEKDDEYKIYIKAKKPGLVHITLAYDEFQELRTIHIHKSMVITENSYFGKSTGSEVIPISVTIIFGYLLFILIKRYNNYKKENLYQYRNIAYLGIIIFVSFAFLDSLLSISNYYGLYSTVSNFSSYVATISFILFPLALITSILVTLSNINLIRKEGLSFRNLLGLFLGMFICISTLLPDFVYGELMKLQIVNIYNLNSAGPYLYSFMEMLVYLAVAYIECILIGTIIIAIKSVRKKVSYDKDYIIILGCKIKKDGGLTPLLKGRVDRALSFRKEQLEKTGKDVIFIPSGGKGKDEVISEADAMKNYLIEQGIDKKNIIVENKSKDTYENIKNSYKLIKNKKSNIVFSTTNYHVLRAGIIATEQNIHMEGIGSKTKTYFWINAFIREFIGTLYRERKKHIIVFVLMIIFIGIMNIIKYFANTI